ELDRAVENISAIIKHIEWQTTDAISALQEEVHGLSPMVLQNRIALNFLLATEGGVCA
ncbi:ERVV1 protein, partial [Toxostoma redivivum]|nr:ERVV1 protein [Toxostoma redivivum]